MAQADLDSMPADNYVPKTADDRIVGYGPSINDTENAAAAKSAGVLDAAYIGYDAALDAYQARSDVEDLAHKNARNHPNTFADADFMRASGQPVTSSGV